MDDQEASQDHFTKTQSLPLSLMEEMLLKDNDMEGSQGALSEQLQEVIRRGSLDFATWTCLISKIEKLFPDNLQAICSVYDSFLLEFPQCLEYWENYVDHNARFCTIDKLVDIYERAVQSLTYSVSIWVEYCSFAVVAYEDPSNVRRLFKRALSFVGKDYQCHPLWDKYFEFELSQQQWSFLAHIHVQALKFPTKMLHRYYHNFKKFVDILEDDMKLHAKSDDIVMESVPDGAITTSKDEISSLIDKLLHPSTGYFRKYISIGEKYYRNASKLEKKICRFENNIQRHNFDATPVDDDELENWRKYLNFVEKQGDFDWAVKLYERCLIPCSGYPGFWMRYVDYMESKGGRELAKSALDRATKVFVKNSPEIYFFSAQFKELIGDKKEPLATFVWPESSLDFVEKVVREANWERRSGNFHRASAIYDTSLEIATERQKLHEVSELYLHYARLIYSMTGKRDQARDVIIQGLRNLPYCKILLKGLINFLMMHGDGKQIDIVDNIVADAIIPKGLSDEDRRDISALYLQFVDLCGTISDIRKARSRHSRLFPHLTRPSSSGKIHMSDNELMELIEPRKSESQDHALVTDEKISTEDHILPDEDNQNKGGNLVEEEACQVNETTLNSAREPTEELEHGETDGAEQGQKRLSLEGLSLKAQEMELEDMVTQDKSPIASGSPSTGHQRNSQDALIYQAQNEQSNHSSLVNHESMVPESAEIASHTSAAQGNNTKENTVASHSVNQQQGNTFLSEGMPEVQPQISAGPALVPQAQVPQYQTPGVSSYNQVYNQVEYYQQAQQMYLQQQLMYNQQYMQQAQQQLNTNQPYGQIGYNAQLQQQQQQLAQAYYCSPAYQHYQQHQQNPGATWDASYYQQMTPQMLANAYYGVSGEEEKKN